MQGKHLRDPTSLFLWNPFLTSNAVWVDLGMLAGWSLLHPNFSFSTRLPGELLCVSRRWTGAIRMHSNVTAAALKSVAAIIKTRHRVYTWVTTGSHITCNLVPKRVRRDSPDSSNFDIHNLDINIPLTLTYIQGSGCSFLSSLNCIFPLKVHTAHSHICASVTRVTNLFLVRFLPIALGRGAIARS